MGQLLKAGQMNVRYMLQGLSVIAVAGLLAVPAQADSSQGAKIKSPTGAPATWSPKVEAPPKDAPSGRTFDAQQLETIKKVGEYFNKLTTLKGVFVQTTSDNKRSRGKFYLKRPGLFRFDYARPSRLRVLSDGKFVAVEDHDLNTVDNHPLKDLPIRILLRSDVDILRDADVLDVQETDDTIVLSLVAKGAGTSGRIKVLLAKLPELQLKEWVITDAHGIDTRVEVAKLEFPEKLDSRLFRRSQLGQMGPHSGN